MVSSVRDVRKHAENLKQKKKQNLPWKFTEKEKAEIAESFYEKEGTESFWS